MQSNPHFVASLCKHSPKISPVQQKSLHNFTLTAWTPSGLMLAMTTHMPQCVCLTIKLTNLKSYRQTTNQSISKRSQTHVSIFLIHRENSYINSWLSINKSLMENYVLTQMNIFIWKLTPTPRHIGVALTQLLVPN